MRRTTRLARGHPRRHRARRRRVRAATTTAPTPPTTARPSGSTLHVPDDHDTIQAAVDAAEPGDLILIEPGTYEEAVDVETEDLTIRGLDRNEVVLDGGFELENGIRVLGRRRRRREHDRPELHDQRLLLDRHRRLPRLVPHRLPQRRLRRLRLRLHQRPVRAQLRVGQPRRRLLHRPVLPLRRRDRRRDLRVQRPRLLGHQLRRQPDDRQLDLPVQPRRHRAEQRLLRALLPRARRPRSSATSCTTTTNRDTPAIDVALLAMGNGILVAGGIAEHDRAQPRVRPRPHRHRPRAVPGGGRQRRRAGPVDLGRRPARRSATTRRRSPTPPTSRSCSGTRRRTRCVGNDVSGSGRRRPRRSGACSPTWPSLDNCFSDNTFTTTRAGRPRGAGPVRRRAHVGRLGRRARSTSPRWWAPSTRRRSTTRRRPRRSRPTSRTCPTPRRRRLARPPTCRSTSTSTPSRCPPDPRSDAQRPVAPCSILGGGGACSPRVGRGPRGRAQPRAGGRRAGRGHGPAGPRAAVQGGVRVEPLGARRPDRAPEPPGPVAPARLLREHGDRRRQHGRGPARRRDHLPEPARHRRLLGARRCCATASR